MDLRQVTLVIIVDDSRDNGGYGDYGSFIPSFDGKKDPSFIGKRIGFARTGTTVITDSLLDANTRPNKSQYLEKIVLVAKNSVGELQEVVKTVNLEYTYELMQTPANRFVQTNYWDNKLRKSVPWPSYKMWDTVYGEKRCAQFCTWVIYYRCIWKSLSNNAFRV